MRDGRPMDRHLRIRHLLDQLIDDVGGALTQHRVFRLGDDRREERLMTEDGVESGAVGGERTSDAHSLIRLDRSGDRDDRRVLSQDGRRKRMDSKEFELRRHVKLIG